MLKSNPKVMVVEDGDSGGWLGHQSGVLTDKISALIEETPLTHAEFPWPFHSVRTQKEDTIYEPDGSPRYTPNTPVH